MRGAGLILLLFFSAAIYHYSRWALPVREELPAVLRLQPQLLTVAVAESGGSYGLYQFSDGSNLIDVINLTAGISNEKPWQEKLNEQPVFSGEILKLIKIEGKFYHIERSWLSARHRILLQIPLHPDRMTSLDWETLPGIGPKLAMTIENDRQKNGDFGEFLMLKRVKGIGVKKLEAWQDYFVEKNCQN